MVLLLTVRITFSNLRLVNALVVGFRSRTQPMWISLSPRFHALKVRANNLSVGVSTAWFGAL